MGQKTGKLLLSKEEVNGYKRSVSFSESEIQDWYKEFRRESRGTGERAFLTEQEFVSVYNKVYQGDSTDFCKHLFRSFDTDHNGQVNFQEFLIGLSVSGSDDPERFLRWAFDVYDVDRTGTISKPEMEEIISSVYKMLNPKHIRIPEEYSTPSLVVEQMFRAMDTDRDDSLTWREFYDGVTQDDFLVNLLQCNPHDTTQDGAVFCD